MLKKLLSRLRATIAPKPAAQPATSEPQKHPTLRRAEASAGQERGHGRHAAGSGHPRERREQPSARPRREEHAPRPQENQGQPRHQPRAEPRAGGRGSLGAQSGSSARPGPRARPTIDQSFDHPRTESIKPVVPVDIPKMDTEFSKLGLSDALAFGVQEMGYVTPTPIQAQAIPVVLRGGDVIGSAQTGTGKTAAFALPIIQRLGGHGPLRCLILEPTRELALQVEEAFQKYAKFTDLRVTIIYGGVGYGKQEDDLRRGMDIVAATPGRLLDHLERGNLTLDKIDILVLDEVEDRKSVV